MNALILLLLPFGLTLALACAIRLALGPERGARIAGVAVAVGFLIAWGLVLRPGWFAETSFGRIGHIALGAVLMGFALDFFGANRLWAMLGAAAVVLVSTWASVNGALWPPLEFTWPTAVFLAALVVIASIVLARLRTMPADMDAPITLLMLAAGLAAVAAVAGEWPIAQTGAMLATAVAGYIATRAFVALHVADGFVLSIGATALAIAWALGQRNASAAMGIALLGLMLFAGGTARRVPLPKARISNILYPLILAGVCALPLLLAVLITFVTRP